jgi:hypothetical protein
MRKTSAVDFTLRGKVEDALRLVRALDGVDKARRVAESDRDDRGVFTVRCSFGSKGKAASAPAGDGDDGAAWVERAVAALVAGGLAVREVRPAGGSLEDVFAELTRDATSSSSASREGPEVQPS